MPEWLKSFILDSIQFKDGDEGGGGDRSTETGDSGDEPKLYTQKELDETVQKAVDKVVGKERGKTERAIKKAQDSAIEEWCKRNEVSEDTLDEFLDWKNGKAKEDSEVAKELRATKRQLAEIESAHQQDKERADLYQGKHRERLTEGALLEAAMKFNALKPQQVVTLLRDRIDLDEDEQVYVKGDNGKVAHGVTVEKMVEIYLNENDNLVASRAPDGGGGSRTARTATTSTTQSEGPQGIRQVLQEMADKGESLLD